MILLEVHIGQFQDIIHLMEQITFDLQTQLEHPGEMVLIILMRDGVGLAEPPGVHRI